MDDELDPVVGNWYRHTDKGQLFRVVAFDEDRGIVELQHFDGDLEEIDASDWFDMNIEPAEAPEDWTGPQAGVDTDDVGFDKSVAPRPWKEPEEADEEKWADEELDDEDDEFDEDDSDEDYDERDSDSDR